MRYEVLDPDGVRVGSTYSDVAFALYSAVTIVARDGGSLDVVLSSLTVFGVEEGQKDGEEDPFYPVTVYTRYA